MPDRSLLTSGRVRVVRLDEQPNVTRRRGWRVGWLRWAQNEPPYHHEWRWLQVHMLTWDRLPSTPALKVQFELKTYRTAGTRSVEGSKRYVRFMVCL